MTGTEQLPEDIRFFGTTWVDHDGSYLWRRVGLSAGSLLALAAGGAVLRFGFQGLADAHIGAFVTYLAVAGFAVCSALAFRRTWRAFSSPASTGEASPGVLGIGFLGVLLAYFFRSFTEAPGEARARRRLPPG